MTIEISARTQAMGHANNALKCLGIDVESENFKGTNHRWVEYLVEYLQPFDAKECLSKTFSSGEGTFHPMVVQSYIPYEAVCAHHLVPVLGVAHVGYVPGKQVVGLSKITRLIHGISHSIPSLQETVGDQVVNALCKYLDLSRSVSAGGHLVSHSVKVPPDKAHEILTKEVTGAMCVIQAEHGCMACRGIKRPGVITSTSSIRGCFMRAEAREEFFHLIASRRSL